MFALGLCAMKAGAKVDRGEASSNISRSEISGCSQSPATKVTVASLPKKEETDTSAASISIGILSEADLRSAEPAEAANVGLSGETIN